jgi:acyl dehydratase
MTAAILRPARTTTLRASEVSPGLHLPEFVIAVTPTLIVTGAIASRDFHRIHHDHAYAESVGAGDIVMNIWTTNGLIGRFITDWAGPDAVLRRLAVRLGTPNRPGDTATFTGTVSSVSPRDDGSALVTVDVTVRNAAGPHATATVDVILPA